MNNTGSYNCVRHIPCGTGYTFNSQSGRCEDNDECALGLHNCEALGITFICRNTKGKEKKDESQNLF